MMRRPVPRIVLILTDHRLLKKARLLTEEIINFLHGKQPKGKKNQSSEKNPQKPFLKLAENRNPFKKLIQNK